MNPAIGFMNFMINQGYEVRPVTLMQDNKSTIKMIESGKSNSERSRHIDIRFYFVNDRVKSGDVRVEYLRTEEMIADMLTKPIQGQRFRFLRDKLMGAK